MDPKDRLIFALDVPNRTKAVEFARTLHGQVGCFKIGLELFVAEGPAVIKAIREHTDAGIFLDLKLHDIPATVRSSVKAATHHKVDYLTVHCGSGLDTLRSAVRGAAGSALKLLAVTVLTSAGPEDFGGVEVAMQEMQLANLVLERARKARLAGCHGVVCSGQEAGHVKEILQGQGLVVGPGIRPAWSQVARDDQNRITTPAQAIADGADLIVVGRPIRDAQDPRDAARRIVEEIAEAQLKVP